MNRAEDAGPQTADLSKNAAYDELRQMDARANLDEINSVNSETGRELTRNTDLGGDEDPGNGSSDSNSRQKAGRDNVLRYLEDHANDLPGGAETFRDLQRQITRMGTERAETSERLARLEGRFEGQGGTGGEEEPVSEEATKREAMLNKLRPGQREIFEALVDELGLVSQDQIEQDKAEADAEAFTANTIPEGIEKFGDDFGEMVNGRFEWNPDLKESVSEVFQRLTSEETGITPMDLYWLVRGPQLIADASGRAVGQEQNNSRERIAKRLRASTTEQSSPGVRSQSVIYDRAKGDTLDTVVNRAVLESLRSG